MSALAGLVIATKPKRATATAEDGSTCLKDRNFSDFIDRHYCPRQSGIRCSGQGNSFILSTSPISLGGGLRGRHDPVQDGSEADGGRQMLQGVVKVAVYGPTDGVSGRQRQAPGLLPLSKRAVTKSCFGQE